MSVLAECRESNKLKITYQPWKAGGYKITFPNDGQGEARLNSEIGIEKISSNAVGHRVEHHLNEDFYAYFGTAISANRFQTPEGDVIVDCGDTIYWSLPATADSEFLGIRDNGYGLHYRESSSSSSGGRFHVGLMSVEQFNNRGVPLSSPSERRERFFASGEVFSFIDRNKETSEGSGCEIRYYGGDGDIKVKRDSVQYVSKELVQSHYSTYFIQPDGEERFVTKRMTQPIKGELFDPYLADPVEIEFTKPSNDYDFYIDDSGTYYWVRHKHKNFNLGDTLGYIASEPGQPKPEYSYSCDIDVCGDNEYQLDCGTHWCCYKPDGVATNRIEKEEG